MIKVYGCRTCGILKIASMRKGLDCPKCRQEMRRLEMTFLEYTEMSENERQKYLKV